MNAMNGAKNILAQNLASLRTRAKLTQERVAESIGVTRQAVAKWEAGESVPDMIHCDELAKLYGVTLDDLMRYDEGEKGTPMPPKGKYIFGTVQVGERGQIVIPKKARDVFALKHGDMLVVLGDTNPDSMGIALVPTDNFLSFADKLKTGFYAEEEPHEPD